MLVERGRMNNLYLDANAHVPMSKSTLKVFSDVQSKPAGYGHASAPARPGQAAATLLEQSRGKIAKLLGAESAANIIFTSGCTQACQWGLDILYSKYKDSDVYYSPVEHSAVRMPIEEQHAGSNLLESNSDGTLKFKNLYGKALVCLHVQNEIGTIHPIESFGADFVFSDMCQTVGKHDLNLSTMKVDIAAFGAHKFGGPTSVGFLYIKDIKNWKAFGTGSRYFNDRPGTPDVAAIAATAAALEEEISSMPKRIKNMILFRDHLENKLESMGLEIIGKNTTRVPNTTFVKVPQVSLLVLSDLTMKGIHVGMGSACGSLHTGPSHLMRALRQEGDGHDFIRISQHGDYGKYEADKVVSYIEKSLKDLGVL